MERCGKNARNLIILSFIVANFLGFSTFVLALKLWTNKDTDTVMNNKPLQRQPAKVDKNT